MTWFNPTNTPPGRSKQTAGWTIMELVIVLLIVGILATYMKDSLDTGSESAKTDLTLQRMEGIRQGILGADLAQSNEGVRANFGFVSDIGRLPANLGELTTQGALPTWGYSTSYGVGAGWRGPYVGGADSLAPATQKDAWGRAFVYSTTLPMPYLSSLGADGAVGGTAANTDVALELPTSLWRSRLSGNVRDGNGIVSGAIVRLNYPVNGALSAVTTTSDASGFYQFNSVPFGVRALQMDSPTATGPSPIVVQRGEFPVPDSVLNYRGGSEAISYQASSLKSYTGTTDIVTHLQSTYSTPVQLTSLTVSWAGGGTYSRLVVNGIVQDFSPAVATATSQTITATMVIPANSSDNSFELVFSADMTGRLITVVLTWLNRTKTDTVSYTP